jgi:outer membrane PBP1 activator LpoA protein
MFLALASCTTAPRISPLESETLAPVLNQARSLSEAGDFLQASERYLTLSQSVPPPWKQQMQFFAAEALFFADKPEEAYTVFRSLDPVNADSSIRNRLPELALRIAESHPDPETALSLLETLNPETLPDAQKQRLLTLKSSLLAQLERHLESARLLITLYPMLNTPEAQSHTISLTWEQLQKIDFETLNTLMPPTPDEVGGWIELIYFSKLYALNPQQLEQEIDSWALRYPNHSSAPHLDTLLKEIKSKIWNNPQQIALLLPLSGRLSDVGKMIQDGFVSGYLDAFQLSKPLLRVYDVGETPARILSVYHQAVSEGADVVVGPLDKASFDYLIQYGDISIPVLGLNYLSDHISPPPGVFQFGLLPEHEAADIAQHALRKGLKKALILIPDNDVGLRHANAFRKAFTEQGGSILDEQEFESQANDFSSSITSVLKISDSESRHQQLTRLLGTRLEFEPRRRQDPDMIFLAATPLQARLINPQLRFHRAGDLPVYAPSRVSSGQIQPSPDDDLNGIHFVDIPWLLSAARSPFVENINQLWAERMNRYARFFALGFDSARLIHEVPMMLKDRSYSYQGYTGYLSLSDSHHLVRALDLALYMNGLPRYQP